MKLLVIYCGINTLSIDITIEAGQLKPRPEMVSTMHINVLKLNVPEFKTTLASMAADTIVLIPPDEPVTDPRWGQLLREITRHVEIMSGRVLFVSSVEALGDAILRTESAVELPFSDYGVFLHNSETVLSEATPRCYLMRFPYRSDSNRVKSFLSAHLQPTDNEIFTLVTSSEMAKVIIDRIQTGWFGKYHVTPNDSLTLSSIRSDNCWNTSAKVPDRSLASRYTWPLTPSRTIWSKL